MGCCQSSVTQTALSGRSDGASLLGQQQDAGAEGMSSVTQGGCSGCSLTAPAHGGTISCQLAVHLCTSSVRQGCSYPAGRSFQAWRRSLCTEQLFKKLFPAEDCGSERTKALRGRVGTTLSTVVRAATKQRQRTTMSQRSSRQKNTRINQNMVKLTHTHQNPEQLER